MKTAKIKYIICLLLCAVFFSGCKHWDDDDKAPVRDFALEDKLEGTWVAYAITDEDGEPFFDVDGYEVIPEDFGYMRFEHKGHVCYTSSGGFLEIYGNPYAVMTDGRLRLQRESDYFYYPLVWDSEHETFMLECRYYINTKGDYLIYFVSFQRL